MTEPSPDDILLACDVGNSRAAIGLVMAGRLEQVVRVPLSGLDGLADVLRLAAGSSAASSHDPAARPWPVLLASVNPPGAAMLQQTLSQLTAGPFLAAGRDFPIPIVNAALYPDRVGVDRLLAALAAWRIVGGPAIVVDVGTAITVDAVDAAGRFLGGAILPGPSLGAWSLHARTAALPEVRLMAAAELAPIGRDTESAIRSGLIFGACGAIERLVAEQRQQLGGPGRAGSAVRIIGTGGGLGLLVDQLHCLDETRPNLVIEGLLAAYQSRG